MSKPTNESVPWQDLVAAAKLMGIEELPADIPLAEACEMFANAVEDVPPDQEKTIDPMVVVIYNDVIIFKVPVTGHAESPAIENKAPAVVENPVTEGAVPAAGGAVETPIPEATKGKKTAAEKEAAKAAKAQAKAEEKAKKAADKAAKKAEDKKNKKKEPGVEKAEGFAAIFRTGILANDPEGIVIQRAFDAYKAKGYPEGKDDKWALARAKRTYQYVYAKLVEQNRAVAKPKPVKEPKAPKEEKPAEAPAAAAEGAAPPPETPAPEAAGGNPTTE